MLSIPMLLMGAASLVLWHAYGNVSAISTVPLTVNEIRRMTLALGVGGMGIGILNTARAGWILYKVRGDSHAE